MLLTRTMWSYLRSYLSEQNFFVEVNDEFTELYGTVGKGIQVFDFVHVSNWIFSKLGQNREAKSFMRGFPKL